MVSARYSGFLHYLQLASHELATIGINVTKNEIPKYVCIYIHSVGSPILPVETAIAVSTRNMLVGTAISVLTGRNCDPLYHYVKGLNEQLSCKTLHTFILIQYNLKNILRRIVKPNKITNFQ